MFCLKQQKIYDLLVEAQKREIDALQDVVKKQRENIDFLKELLREEINKN